VLVPKFSMMVGSSKFLGKISISDWVSAVRMKHCKLHNYTAVVQFKIQNTKIKQNVAKKLPQMK